jgi:hypothetical protein
MPSRRFHATHDSRRTLATHYTPDEGVVLTPAASRLLRTEMYVFHAPPHIATYATRCRGPTNRKLTVLATGQNAKLGPRAAVAFVIVLSPTSPSPQPISRPSSTESHPNSSTRYGGFKSSCAHKENRVMSSSESESIVHCNMCSAVHGGQSQSCRAGPRLAIADHCRLCDMEIGCYVGLASLFGLAPHPAPSAHWLHTLITALHDDTNDVSLASCCTYIQA